MADNLYESADPKMLAEILGKAESLLEDQLTVAVAADQRALTFAGLLAAAVAAMIGAVASLGGSATLPIVVLATVLTIAAGAALWSARPTEWWFRGNEPIHWQTDIIGQRDLHAARAEVAAHYDTATTRNRRALNRAANAMRLSMGLTGAALSLAIVWAWVAVLK